MFAQSNDCRSFMIDSVIHALTYDHSNTFFDDRTRRFISKRIPLIIILFYNSPDRFNSTIDTYEKDIVSQKEINFVDCHQHIFFEYQTFIGNL